MGSLYRPLRMEKWVILNDSTTTSRNNNCQIVLAHTTHCNTHVHGAFSHPGPSFLQEQWAACKRPGTK